MNVLFDFEIGLKERINKPLIYRDAVRAVIIDDGKLLMLSTKKGDFKLPGGGIEESESELEALIREVKEETGYSCDEIIGPIGKVFERRIDSFDDNYLFEMNSTYYFCTVDGDVGEQSLTEEEIELGFEVVWIDIERALSNNIEFLSRKDKRHQWTNREVKVLEIIKNNIKTLERHV